MSKAYHPDQLKTTDGTDPSLKFREITEAYEVLGNYHKRKMYDKGLLKFNVAATPAEAEDYATKFYGSRQKRSQAPTSSGRTPIYNFDEWSKLHYETTRIRREETKQHYEELLRRQHANSETKKANSIVSIFVLIGIGIVLNMMCTQNADKVKTKGS